MTSLFVSASTTASCTHFMAVSKSTISPFRTPREGAWPTPRILIVPSGRPSPTTTQIFDVPISRPTNRSLLAIILNPFCHDELELPFLPASPSPCSSASVSLSVSVKDEPELLLEFGALRLQDRSSH